MLQVILWGGLLRFLQALIQSAPTVLVGLVVAGIFRRLLGHEGTRRLFGSGTWRELPQAWAIGMLMPVCSLGVIPVAREMRRAKISGGTTLAFAMTAPLFNPLSLLYGLTLSEPMVIFAFSLCSMVVVTVVGASWDRIYPGVTMEEIPPKPISDGLKRMIAIVVDSAREIVGPTLGYIVIGLLGVATLSAVLPPGSLQSTMEHKNVYAPLAMVGVALPAYATPMVAMGQVGSMFQHANSVGAAFVLLTLGAGVNLGLMAWMFLNYGLKRGLVWFTLLLTVVLGLAYAIESPLYPKEITPAGHTHAFDIYCRPFGPETRNLPEATLTKLKEDFGPFDRLGVVALGSLMALGLALKAMERRWRIENWLERTREKSDRAASWYEVAVPGPVLGGVALLGLLVFSVVGCFAYYPSPKEIFDEMAILKAEVLTAATSGERKHAEHFLPVWSDWTRRLEVGMFLREFKLSPYRRMKSKVFRDRLELLKHAIEEGDHEETREFVGVVSNAYSRMRLAYFESQ